MLRGTAGSVEEGAALGGRLLEAGLDAVIVLQTMAVMPSYMLACLRLVPDLPVIVWALHRQTRLPSSFDHSAITSEGATVGTPMLTNVLVRSGRPFELIVGVLDGGSAIASVEQALRCAVAASQLRRARIGQVGPVFQGYECVDADNDRLSSTLGVKPVPIEAAELRELYLAVAPARVAELERETRELYDVGAEAEGDSLERSLRAACALEDLVERHRLDAGAINCHVPELRFGPEVGIAPCFALGRETSRGTPWACAGDVVTAVAMLTVKLLGGAAEYHELEAFDHETGEFVVASSGEHDLAFAGERPRLIPNRWFASDPRCGVCACSPLQPALRRSLASPSSTRPRPASVM